MMMTWKLGRQDWREALPLLPQVELPDGRITVGPRPGKAEWPLLHDGRYEQKEQASQVDIRGRAAGLEVTVSIRSRYESAEAEQLRRAPIGLWISVDARIDGQPKSNPDLWIADDDLASAALSWHGEECDTSRVYDATTAILQRVSGHLGPHLHPLYWPITGVRMGRESAAQIRRTGDRAARLWLSRLEGSGRVEA